MSFKLFYSIISLKIFILFIILMIFLIGLIDYTLISEKNKCEMTFMFQFPQFIPIHVRNQINEEYPNYNLYVYGEGQYAETLRLGELNGVPVVFVPGNGGSYKQVRSLGSVALRMSHRYSTSFHLNYFTIDFNEELSAVNSHQLQRQTLFLKEAVIKIITLYKREGRDEPLILIGHSIGGLIIRSMLTLSEFKPYLKSIVVIITLATPHKSPVVPIDSKMTTFYDRVENYWRLNRNKELSHINVISIGGGFNDKLVRSDLTKLRNESINDLSIVTTSIDDVWVSTDHLCIVWCKQLVLKLTRLVFDLIDENSLQIVENDSYRNKIIKYHLIGRTLGKSYPKFVMTEYTRLSSAGDLAENRERIIRISKPKVIKTSHILLPLMKRESIVIQFEGIYNYDWIMACNVTINNNKTFCDKGLNLNSYVKLMPSEPNDVERRLFRSVSSSLINKGFSHLLLSIPASTQPINIITDRFTTTIRTKTIVLPTLMQSITMLFSPVTILNIAVSEQTTFYNLTLIGLQQIWHSYWINLETVTCYQSASNIGYLYFTIPWNRENKFKFIYPKRGQNAQMTLKVNTPKPNQFMSDNPQPTLYLILDPDCGYKLHLKPSLSEIMGQILRHYAIILLPMIVSILLSVLAIQLNTSQTNYSCLSNNDSNQNFFSAQPKYCYEQSIIIMKNIISVSLYGILILSSVGFTLISNYFQSNSITSELSQLTYTQLISLYTVLFTIAYSMTYFFLVFITITFMALSHSLIFLESKFLTSHSKLKLNVIEKSNKSFKLKKVPLISLVLLLATGITCISSLSFLISLFIHNIQLICLSKKCESIQVRKGLDSDSSLWRFHLTLLALLYFSIIPTIPMLLDWLNLELPLFYFGFADPHLIPAIILSLSCAVIWHPISNINSNKFERKLLSITLKAMAIISSILCQINYSTISLIISIAFLFVSLHQLSEWYRSRRIKCD